jgi:hypothetical protein
MHGGVGQELLGLEPVHVDPVCGSGRKGDGRWKRSENCRLVDFM